MSAYEVPDGIECIEGWRFWSFDDHGLKAVVQDARWKPGERMEATCVGAVRGYRWEPTKDGMTTEAATEHRNMIVAHQQQMLSFRSFVSAPLQLHSYPPPSVPTTLLPRGFGWNLVQHNEGHDSPEKGCTCGIYAATEIAGCPSGQVFGKVKMWGKIVPGEKGWRAQYAYPSELWAPKKLADHPALLAYGVPVHVTEAEPSPAPSEMLFGPQRPRRRWWSFSATPWTPIERVAYFGCIGLNLASAFLNWHLL